MPRFDRTKRYRNKAGQTFGKGVWFDDNGNMMRPGESYDKDNKARTVTQYNTDGTKTVFSWEKWAAKNNKDHEVRVLQNDRKYAIPDISSKRVTLTIDNNSPTRKNAGATFSENVLDSIAVNAKKAELPFSTALGMVATESTFGVGNRGVGHTPLPWLRHLNQDNGKQKDSARRISYNGVQSPTLLVSNWNVRNEGPFHKYLYNSQGQLRDTPRPASFYDEDFNASRNENDKYHMEDVSPLYRAFKKYRTSPNDYNPNDKTYPSKVDKNTKELVNYSPEIREYMKKNHLHSEGGNINHWSNLSMQEKAAMMQVAVRNGLRNLEDIREAYNEFAEGGNLSDDEYYSIMERVAKENNPLWNKEREKEGRFPLTVDEEYLRLLNDNSYNYRGYYNKYPQSKANADTHWTDEFKTVWHPTFSNESVYSGRKSQYNPFGLTGGWWAGDGDDATFMPMAWQLQSANQFKGGGYKPSAKIKNQISQWEGKAMTGAKDPLSGKYSKNNSFESEARGFYNALPESIRERVLSNQGLADSLYSYSYNVGAGNFKKRVVPALERYYVGDGTAEDIAKSMWASGDSKLKGLQKRREAERNGVRSALWDDQTNKVNQMINSTEPQYPAFMPYHPDIFASPLVTYEPPVVTEEQVQPLVEAAMAYSPEELAREEKRDRLRGINMMLGMLGRNGEYDDMRDILNTVGRMVPEKNELAYEEPIVNTAMIYTYGDGGNKTAFTPIKNPVIPKVKGDQEAINWLSNWYNNRREQMYNNLKEYDGLQTHLYNVKDFLTGNPAGRRAINHDFYNKLNNMARYKTASFEDLENDNFPSYKQSKNVYFGLTVPDVSKVYYDNALIQDAANLQSKEEGYSPLGIHIHERTHTSGETGGKGKFTGFNVQTRALEDIIKLKPGIQQDEYLDAAPEIYGRIMEFRYNHNLNPKKKYTKEEIQKFLNQENKAFKSELQRYDLESLTKALNEVAQIDLNNSDTFSNNHNSLA